MHFFQTELLLANHKPSLDFVLNEVEKILDIKFSPNSPDLLALPTEEGSLSADDFGQLTSWASRKPHTEKYKVAIIFELDRATMELQNRFLKIIEEPPTHTFLLFTATNKNKIIPTIMSRVLVNELNSIKKLSVGDFSKLITEFLSSDFANRQKLINGPLLKLSRYQTEELMQEFIQHLHDLNVSASLDPEENFHQDLSSIREIFAGLKFNPNLKLTWLNLAISISKVNKS